MGKKKAGRNPNDYGGPEWLESGKVRWKATVSTRRRVGPSRLTEAEARADFWTMIEAERRAAEIEAVKTQAFGWWMHGLYRVGGTLEGENYAPSSLALGRLVNDRYVRGTALARTDLARVTEDAVREWFATIPGMPRTRGRYLSVVRAALERAVRDRKIQTNPAARVRPPKADEPEVRVLKEDQAAAFLEELKIGPGADRLAALDALGPGRWRRLSPEARARLHRAGVLMLHGLRRAELLGLRHEDHDEGGVWVRRQASADGTIRNTTKGRRGRWVPLDDEARAILESRAEGWVFPAIARGKRPSERPYAPRNLARDMDAALRLTPFEGIDPHDLRHTHATLMLRAGVDVRVAADIMGHDPAVLAKVYARSDQDDRREALRKLRKGRPSQKSSPPPPEGDEREPETGS